jgi:hypothetical protein
MSTTDSQHLADLLAAHWHLMWPLDPAERIRRINEVRADLEYELELRLVFEHMAAA